MEASTSRNVGGATDEGRAGVLSRGLSALTGKAGESLATTATLPPSTDGWQDSALEFNAPAAGAVRVALRRKPCTSSPCPAFGSVWLDAFELRRL